MDWVFCPWTCYLPVTSIPIAFYVAGIQTHVHIDCWDYRANRPVCGTFIRRDRPVTNRGFLNFFRLFPLKFFVNSQVFQFFPIFFLILT